MKLLIISANPKVYSINHLDKAATEKFTQIVIARPSDVEIKISDTVDVSIKSEPIENFDKMIFRYSRKNHFVFFSELFFALSRKSLLNRVLNGKAIKTYGLLSKLQQLILFSQNDLPIVTTTYCNDLKLNFSPSVFKHLHENNGKAVALIDDLKEADGFISKWKKNEIIQQQYIKSDCDYRILVLNGQVLGGFAKYSNSNFITNIHSGGTAKSISHAQLKKLSPIAIQAARACQLDFAGVDIIADSDQNPYILEINPTPGFKGFEQVNEINVADVIINFLLHQKL